MEGTTAIILAAGDGKRMKSKHPKVMCEVLFKPMISWVLDMCVCAGITKGCAVVGSGAKEIEGLLPNGFTSVPQNERLGTGHAASMAAGYIREGGFFDVLVLYGDAPFFKKEDIEGAYMQHKKSGSHVTLISAQLENPFGYGRVIRDGQRVSCVIEERDADEKTKKINEINAGVYWFDAAFLLDFFDNMSCDNSQGEYYLTDVVGYGAKNGKTVTAYMAGADTVLGANDRRTLSLLNEIARWKVFEKLWEQGVDIPCADGVVIGADVKIGCDTVILPGTIIKGATVIGSGCEIGPNSYLENAVIGDDCKVQSTFIDSSTLESGVKIGPMSNVRPNCTVRAGAKIGDFVELKNSDIGPKTSVAHLTYIGDSDVGGGCNFGCGVVTTNYDGSNKHRTTIGDDVFIGCNCNLIPPVTVGDRAYAAAGTTITDNVPPDAMVIGRARQTVKEGWAKDKGLYRKK